MIAAKEPRVFYWLKNGALPTDTVRSLFQRNGLWLKWSLTKRGKDEATIAAEMEKWQMQQAESAGARQSARPAARPPERKASKSAGAEAGPGSRTGSRSLSQVHPVVWRRSTA